MKRKYIKPVVGMVELEDDLMLIGGSTHTTTTDFRDSPLLDDEEDFPGYMGEIDPDDPSDPPFFF